ncbi:MAG: hypothetical protein HQ575_07145 [Candidatus Omnitrophica bacterium]|nr:hypothetical protein [Candidatus Omnitrophota bacterium]
MVLDPFAGAGTTCFMAKALGRNYVGIDINSSYVKMSKKRLDVFGHRAIMSPLKR